MTAYGSLPSVQSRSVSAAAPGRLLRVAGQAAQGDPGGGQGGEGTGVQGERGGGDAQRRAGRAGEPAEVGTGRVEAQQERTGVFEEPPPGGGGGDGPSTEERQPEVGLQGGDVLGDGRLGVAQLAGGLGEGGEPGDGDVRTEEVRVHGAAQEPSGAVRRARA
ncbi:hypothetical protein SNARM312S_05741 [Streptomyces narbonensis]